MENSSRQNECSICSFLQRSSSPVPIYNRHFSSLYHRQITGAEDSEGTYLCPSCMAPHMPYPDQRLKIVVSDSMMHQFFAPPGYTQTYSGDNIHVDYLTIASADIRTLTDAFRLEYIDFPPTSRPMDVVLVAGYENLVEGHSRDQIIEEYDAFARLIKGGAGDLRQDNETPHTVAITSLAYPPKLAWMRDDGPYPSNAYVNRKEKIDWINGEIARLNRTYLAVNPPCIHTFGIRTTTTPIVNRYGRMALYRSKRHRWESWVGQDRAEMLFLRPDKVFKIGMAINNYFRFNT